MRRLRIFAGPNGSGKTTLYDYLLGKRFFKVYYHINPDEIAEELPIGLNLESYPIQIKEQSLRNLSFSFPFSAKGKRFSRRPDFSIRQDHPKQDLEKHHLSFRCHRGIHTAGNAAVRIILFFRICILAPFKSRIHPKSKRKRIQDLPVFHLHTGAEN